MCVVCVCVGNGMDKGEALDDTLAHAEDSGRP